MVNNIVQLHDVDEMKKQGSLWLSKLDRGLSPNEEVLLKAWLAESNQNREYFIGLAKQWDQLSVLSQLSDVIPYEKRKRKWTSFAVAASFICMFLLGAFLFNNVSSFQFNNTQLMAKSTFLQSYYTAVGEKSIIHLPDSSILTLNTNSIVKVNFTEKKRELILKKGEAHIKVAHNKERMLVLTVGEKSFVAVGTAFNVQYDSKSVIELIVTEGKVAVSDAELTDELSHELATVFSNKNLASNSDNDQLLVSAGERVIITAQDVVNHKVLVKENIAKEIDESLAWREGKLIFEGETLEEVVEEISRYSNIDIEFKSEQLKYLRIGGRFRTGDIDGLLGVLDEQFHIKAQRLETSKIQLSYIQ